MDSMDKSIEVGKAEFRTVTGPDGIIIIDENNDKSAAFIHASPKAAQRARFLMTGPRLLAACEKAELYLVSVGVPETHAVVVELREVISQARGEA